MLRLRSRLLVPALVLIVLGFLVPALAQALPVADGALSVGERPEATGTSRLSQLWSLLAAFWAETGSGLEPDGRTAGASSGVGAEPGAASSTDNGPGLDPNG